MMSGFSNSTGPIVSKAAPVRPKTATPSSSSSSGAPAKPSRPPPNGMSSAGASSKVNSERSSQPTAKPRLATPGSSSLKPKPEPLTSKAKSPLGHSSTSASPRPSSVPSRKKRSPSPIRSESSSSSSGSSDEGEKGAVASRGVKRPKHSHAHAHAHANGNGKRSGAHSRTTTATPALGDPGTPSRRGMFCLDKVDARGEWGRGWIGFTNCQEAIARDVTGWAGGKGEGKSLLDRYLPYFPQPGFENADPLPSVELLYPGGAREKFILLNAPAGREYAPILELRSALQMILDLYIPPSHAHIFGTLSTTADLDAPLQAPTPAQISTPPPETSASSPAGAAPSTPSAIPQLPTETIADALRKALAPNRRDGPGFVRAMERFNVAFQEILDDGSVGKWLVERNRQGVELARWSKLVDVVHEAVYSRVVAPYYLELEHHPKHPDSVAQAITDREDSYGELRHNFMSRIIAQTNLGPQSTFVDLGSGVGNCVIQASLEAGCRSFGVELLPTPAHCARLQLREVQRRWAMWGLNGNLDCHVEEGDFRGNGNVARWLQDADVVLVNNEVFPPSLNVELTNLFLDLKEGAVIVSLKPFVPENFKMSSSNCDSFAAIVNLSTHTYYSDWVTWKGDSGKYYTQVIDRSRRKQFEDDLMKGRRR